MGERIGEETREEKRQHQEETDNVNHIYWQEASMSGSHDSSLRARTSRKCCLKLIFPIYIFLVPLLLGLPPSPSTFNRQPETFPLLKH
jgi:hypothetical protein